MNHLRTLADAPDAPDGFGKGGFDPVSNGGGLLLSYLSWCVSAAAVAGVIVVGIQLSLRLHAGEPGEGAVHFRGLVIILGACVIGVSAGPIVNFLL